MKKIWNKLAAVFNRNAPDEIFWDELWQTLIESDVGVEVTSKIIKSVKDGRTTEEVKKMLSDKMVDILSLNSPRIHSNPHVILVVGVNGVGKTTTIAKLAKKFKNEGKSVLLVAADTFRAAAVEQLEEWGKRLNMEVQSQDAGADSAAVAFDGIKKACARNFDTVIIDTAGRLHTKQNLMEELKKVSRVIGKALADAPHEKILVIDATVGSNGLNQAREFNNALGLTGVIVTKLDGTAKGGIVLAIAGELSIPFDYIGVGEGINDLEKFNAREFVLRLMANSS